MLSNDSYVYVRGFFQVIQVQIFMGFVPPSVSFFRFLFCFHL